MSGVGPVRSIARDLPPILHVEDLARVLGTTTHGAAEACRRGRIPASKPGRRWIVRREALLAVLKREERAHRSPNPKESEAARLFACASPDAPTLNLASLPLLGRPLLDYL